MGRAEPNNGAASKKSQPAAAQQGNKAASPSQNQHQQAQPLCKVLQSDVQVVEIRPGVLHRIQKPHERPTSAASPGALPRDGVGGGPQGAKARPRSAIGPLRGGASSAQVLGQAQRDVVLEFDRVEAAMRAALKQQASVSKVERFVLLQHFGKVSFCCTTIAG